MAVLKIIGLITLVIVGLVVLYCFVYGLILALYYVLDSLDCFDVSDYDNYSHPKTVRELVSNAGREFQGMELIPLINIFLFCGLLFVTIFIIIFKNPLFSKLKEKIMCIKLRKD